jgi:hypothetical protein
MTDQPTTIRDAIEAAMPNEEAPVAVQQPVQQDNVPDFEPSLDAPIDTGESVEQPLLVKDEPKAEAAPEAASEGVKPGPKSEPKSQDKAPASWKPELREHWGTLPAPVRNEIARRESEVQRTLKETAEARKYADTIAKAISPYEMFIQAEGSSHAQAVANVMATAARLRTAPAPDLANMVAGIVKQFGIGRFGKDFIEQLDQALVGEVPQMDPQVMAVQQAVQQQMAPVQQFMNQFQQAQQMQQQRVSQEAQGEVQNFLSQAEFANDVREDMADLMEVAQRRGRELTLQEAYKQACLTNPQVRAVLQARSKQQGGQRMTETAQRAKAAAVQVTGSPALAAPTTNAAPNIRSAIEAALAAHSR